MTPAEGLKDGNSGLPEASAQDDDSELAARAAQLVNPKSGIANDFLNHFNEILLLIENLPLLLPEMVDELLQWRAKTYREYFQNSNLPGSGAALEIYANLESEFRRDFEMMVARLNLMALEDIHYIKEHRGPNGEINPDEVSEFCETASAEFRKALENAANMVNHGQALPPETPQHMADRLLNPDQDSNSSSAEGKSNG
jgi:hypothetical protein